MRISKSISVWILSIISIVVSASETTFLVFDEQGKGVPYAHVLVTDIETGQKQFTTTEVSGQAVLDIKSSFYLEVSFVGFSTFHDTLDPGRVYRIELEEDPLSLDEVVLTAQYAPVSSRNSVFPVKVLGIKQIESRAAFNLEQLLENQLNIRVSQDNAIGSTGINLQGLGGENVKILIDGVPMIGRLNGQLDISQINLNNVERVEVLEGPMSVAYGTNALGGVINIITKKPKDEIVRGNANGYYESVGVYNFDGGAEFAKSGKRYGVNVGRYFFDGFSPVDEGRNQQWNQKEQIFGDAIYGRKIQFMDFQFRSNPFWEQIKDRGSVNAQNRAFDAYYNTIRWMNTASIRGKISDKYYLEGVGAFNFYERKRNTYIVDMETLDEQLTADPNQQDTNRFVSYMSRASLSSRFDDRKWNYQIGYDVNHEVGTGRRIEDGIQSMTDLALFGSVQIETDRWLIQPGVRFAYNSQYDAPIVPSINAKYHANEKLWLRFSYARGFRAPSLKELYLDFVDANHNVSGNDSLLAENSHSLNLSSSFYFGSSRKVFKIEPMLFFNHINNRIQLVYVGPNPVDYSNANIGRYQTAGGRVQFSYEMHPQLELRAGAGLTGINAWLENTNTGFQYTPEVNATASYNWYKQMLNVNLYYKYTGASPQPQMDADNQLVISEIPGFHMVDFTVTKKFFHTLLTASAGVKNALDVTNLNLANGSTGGAHGGGGALPISWGRTFFVGLKLDLTKSLK